MSRLKTKFRMYRRKFAYMTNYLYIALMTILYGFALALMKVAKVVKKGVIIIVFFVRFFVGCNSLFPGEGIGAILHYFISVSFLTGSGIMVLVMSLVFAFVALLITRVIFNFVEKFYKEIETCYLDSHDRKKDIAKEIKECQDLLKYGSMENKFICITEEYKNSKTYIER